MIPALQHDYDNIEPQDLRAALDARGGIDGWTLTGVLQGKITVTLFWSRQAPASPNTGET